MYPTRVKRLIARFFIGLSMWLQIVHAGVNVLTFHNDNARTGQNTNETILTPQNVNTNSFGKLFTQTVDGYVYAQPLVLTGVNIPGKGVHDVVFIATEHDTVYAFDAYSNTGSNAAPLWQVSFINPPNVSTLSSSSINCNDITPEIGISSTPVIDPITGTIYVEAKTIEISSNPTSVHRLHALDVATGTEKFGGPVVIQGSVNGVNFWPPTELNQAGLLLNNGVVYLGFSSHCDIGIYYGWLIGYGAQTLTLSNIFNVTPHGYGGTIWQAGGGPAADTNGNIYFISGHGTYDGAASQDYANSFLKLSTSNGLAVATYFTPYNQASLGTLDFGTGGAMLLPDEAGSATHPHLMVGSGAGKLYLVDRDNLGGYSGGSSDSQIVQSFPAGFQECLDTPAYFNHTLYYCGTGPVGDYVRAFTITNGSIATNPSALSPTAIGYPGASCTISANGTNNGLVWAVNSVAYSDYGPAVLHAYNAANLGVELYNSSQAAADAAGPAVKSTVPTVANGRVYVGGQYSFSVYGPTVATPAIFPNGALFTNSISITITDATPNAAIYYTLDGSTPTTNSLLYSTSITITNSLTIQAGAFLAGAFNSGVASASFTNFVPTVATPVILPNGALFTNSISITITDATPAAAIYYTLDGSTPTTNSLLYSAPFAITNSLTVQAEAFLSGAISSSVASASFTHFVPTVATPAIFPNGALFTNSISITITDATPGATIYYTLDGSTPTTNSLLYSAPFTITNSSTVMAGAFQAGQVNSSVASASFTRFGSVSQSAVNVLTYHNNNARTGLNTSETVLTPANVNFNSFGKIFSQTVDGYVYAQPLIVCGVNIPGRGRHDVLYVATQHSSVYAFDAYDNTGPNSQPLWQTNFLGPNVTTVSSSTIACGDIVPEISITSTPVIDTNTGTIYVEANTQETVNGVTNNVHRLHALDLATGAEKFGGPTLIQPSIAGTGTGNDGSGHVPFVPVLQMNRAALLLNGGVVYMGFASHCVMGAFHGWLIGCDAHTLAVSNVFNVTPNAYEGGIWQGGCGPAADADGNIFVMTGNGAFDANQDFGDSLLRLSTTNGLQVADYFTPGEQAILDQFDWDFGSGGALLLPDEVGSAAHPHLVVGAGKEGIIFLVDRDNLGGYVPNSNSQIVQTISNAFNNGESFVTPAYFNKTLYYCVGGDYLRSYSISNASIAPTPTALSPTFTWWPGSTPSISANGMNDAIVWTIDSGHYNDPATYQAAILHAYNATNVNQELYNSMQAGNGYQDYPGPAVKFSVPTVANGHVYVGAAYAVSVYGLISALPPPAIVPGGGTYTNSISVTLTDAVPNATIYYQLNSPGAPTNVFTYSGPFVLTNNVTVQAWSVTNGVASRSVTSASFTNAAILGTGTGLSGAYFASNSYTNPFIGSPALVKTDTNIDFTWGTNGPSPAVGSYNYTVRWTGGVVPQYSETYTFTTYAQDGVRLYVNGQLVIDDWKVKAGPTLASGTINLSAQTLYNFELDYFEGSGSAVVALAWASTSTPFALIPQSQLYPFTNAPPTIVLLAPANGATYTAPASVSLTASASTAYNSLGPVSFYANTTLLGSVTNPPYALTATGLGVGSYALTAVVADGSGLVSTSAPVNITVAAATGQPYGLTNLPVIAAFTNLPSVFNLASTPALLSLTGVFSNTPAMAPATGFIPYLPNTPLWSDGALKTRYFAIPNNGGIITSNEQITYSPTGTWSFPAGTVFVKTFELNTDTANPAVRHRLETRLLVRDSNGGVYGLTYKWRANNLDADLLSNSLSENILITNAGAVSTQTWYYPSPADCLTCHTPVAKFVLGLSTRQLNASQTYPATGVTDNQLRTLNRLGLLNPAFDEASITNLEKLSALTNLTASLQERVRSYLDANCAQCHQPGGTGPTFDARYDTPLANQHITNYPANVSLGVDHTLIIKSQDIWRSAIYQRINTTNAGAKMPPLARNLMDTNAVSVIGAWINSLPGVPALAPPLITPNGGAFYSSANVTLLGPDTNAAIYFTLDGSLPTTNSLRYFKAFNLTSNATVTANAFETNYDPSVAASAVFAIWPANFVASGYWTNGQFQMGFIGTPGSNYVLLATTNFVSWTPLTTNLAGTNQFNFADPHATNYRYRFYRVLQQP